MPRVRTVIAGLSAGLLLSGLAAPVAAQTTTTLSAAEAESAATTLSIAGEPALGIAETAAAAVPGQAVALGNPLAVGGAPIGGLLVESDGDAVADDECVTPEVQAPLNALLDGALVCADVAADGDARSASATAGVAQAGVLNVSGEELGPLNDLLLDQLPLDALTDALEDALLAELDDAFADVRAECLNALEPLNIAGLLDPVLGPLGEAAPEDVAGLLEQLDELLDGAMPAACDALGDLAGVLVDDGGLLGSITDGALLDALEDSDGVLDVTLLETSSMVDRDGDDITAEAGPGEGAIGMTLSLPLAEILGDLLETVLEAGAGDLIDAIEETLDGVGGAADEVPLIGDIISPLLTTGDVAAILDGPLLDIGVLPGSSSAFGDLGEVTTGGDSSPALVSLDGSLLNLPVLDGLDDSLDAAANVLDEALLAELRASELAQVVDVALLPGDVIADDVQGLSGTRATSGTASVALLGALEDEAGGALVDLRVAPAEAAVGVGEVAAPSPEPEPEPEPTPTPVTTAGPDADPLPVTGAGAALFGLMALGAAAMLRRRG